MFDFHMHSTVSYDSTGRPEDMVKAALAAGIREMCFTDHLDYDPMDPNHKLSFDTEVYNASYDHLEAEGIKIRRGMEFGMLEDNADVLKQDLQRRHFDFVIGSAHFTKGYDPYFDVYWADKDIDRGEMCYFEQILDSINAHDDFDVLGHMTYISKAWANPVKRPVEYARYREIADEIMKVLVSKGKGMELNTSGKDPCGVFLPSEEYLRRFKELGGEIVTVGSDAHDCVRVGQYCHEACKLVCDIFGYVCTFEDRKPIFHKL